MRMEGDHDLRLGWGHLEKLTAILVFHLRYIVYRLNAAFLAPLDNLEIKEVRFIDKV
jgi:hypothetical protein